MAFSMGNGSGNRGRFRAMGTLSEMNVVPLVDVVLVLLIIFMLTAHVMEFGLEVEVPTVKQVADSVEELPVLTITRDGELYLADKPVMLAAIQREIAARYKNHKAVYVRADKAARWDPIAQVISALHTAKVEVRMVTKPAEDAPRRR